MLFAGSAKVGERPGCDEVGEGVERRPLPRVVKRHLAPVHVQNDADDLGMLGHV